MADTAHHIRRHKAAYNKAAGPGCAEQTERGGGVTFDVPADGEQDALQAIAHEEEKRSEKQRGDGQQISSHMPTLDEFDFKKT
jgi:hypothetical protein